MAYDADVIVIGAGPAGCAASIPLARAGHAVMTLERKATEDGEDITSGEVLAPATQHECEQLGVALEGSWLLDRLEGLRNVYPDLSWTYHPFPPGMFYVHVDRGGFNAALRERVVEVGARLVWDARVAEVDLREDRTVVRTAGGAEYSARLVIDAAGRHAPTPRIFGLKQEDPEFRQIGVAVFFSSFSDTPLHTWDRHLYGHHGAMISGARIRPGLYRYILEADLADKQAERLRPVEFYENTARQHDPWIYERIMKEPRIGDVWAMAPLGYRVPQVARDRLLLAGDAAGYLSPITGQGMEFAMRMGRLAADSARRALQQNDFSADSFADYIRGRQDELETAVSFLRHQLRNLRDRDALLRAAHDDAYRVELLGPIGAMVADRGSLRLPAAS
jgi:flavin-dependent dehydrogenase